MEPGNRRHPHAVACFSDLFLALAILVALDAALFHYGGYAPLLAPESFSGRLESTRRRLAFMRANAPEKPFLLIAGNSTAEAAVNERTIERRLAKRNLPFAVFNAALSGNSVLAWSHLIENLPEFTDRTDCLVYGLYLSSLVGRFPMPRDIAAVKSTLRIRDAFSLASWRPTIETRLATATSGLFRAPLFREDMADLLRHPRMRREQFAARERREAKIHRGYRKHNRIKRRMPKAVLKNGQPFPAFVPAFIANDKVVQRRILMQMKLYASGKLPRRGPRISPMQLAALERIALALRDRKIHLVLAILPASPYPYRPRGTEAVERCVTRLKARGVDVSLFNDEPLLRLLEHPRYFRDLLHLNQEGETRYTARLARFLAADLPRGAPRGP